MTQMFNKVGSKILDMVDVISPYRWFPENPIMRGQDRQVRNSIRAYNEPYSVSKTGSGWDGIVEYSPQRKLLKIFAVSSTSVIGVFTALALLANANSFGENENNRPLLQNDARIAQAETVELSSKISTAKIIAAQTFTIDPVVAVSAPTLAQKITGNVKNTVSQEWSDAISAAVTENDTDAKVDLSVALIRGMYGFSQDKTLGFELLGDAVKENNQGARFNEAYYMATGEEPDFIRLNQPEAFKNLTQLVNEGYAPAQDYLTEWSFKNPTGYNVAAASLLAPSVRPN